MYSHQSPIEVAETNLYCNKKMNFRDVNPPLLNSTNKYVYVKQNFINPSHIEPKSVIPKVLVNPHFNKKVFVNPNFNPAAPSGAPKIHVNPNVQRLNVNVNVKDCTSIQKIHVNPNVQRLNLNVNVKDCTSIQKIHVNPNVLRNKPLTVNNTEYKNQGLEVKNSLPEETNCVTYSTGNKLTSYMDNVKNGSAIRKRRSSIRSKFKIVKFPFDNSLEKVNQEKKRTSIRSKYKIIKSNYSPPKCFINAANKFKVDNRNRRTPTSPQKNKKYVYVNRFLSISDIARNSLLKHNSKFKKPGLINVSGVLYKKSPNCLRRTSILNKVDNSKKAEEATISKSKFKFVRKSTNKTNVDVKNRPKLSRSLKVKKIISPGKLRICNIPCPYYRKYGRCRGKDNGKCYRKHDADQIALCTKFLQGACIDKKCLLSHNVSPEKMPTCKFYLEGSCSRDDCPYLHVRISPKADICKDFLVGFCKKGAECNKRHQFLCPDHEKNGSCLKQKCPYPHGNSVRKYSVLNKNKFAKKSSKSKKEPKNKEINKETEVVIGKEILNCENFKTKTNEIGVKNRYYIEQNFGVEDKCLEAVHGDNQSSKDTINSDQENGMRSRPKLGKLPSFIALEG